MEQREIKFRAWHPEEGMIYEGWNRSFYATIALLFGYGEDAIRLEFTGKKDRNSKDVYEGDICKAKFTTSAGKLPVFGKIEMDEFMWCLTCPDGESYSINRLHDFEIIGNVYEHADLLTAKTPDNG